jgi:predicted esterase
MKETLTAPRTYRYFTYGNPETASKLIYVFHGYGQLAEYFIRKFHSLPEDYFIVAPEGMHRFYIKGSSGRVGASWMTKDDRESDIHDNLQWLNILDQEIMRKYSFKEKFILGFSQGGSAACRQHFNGTFNADHLIVWASSFPPEMESLLTDDDIGLYSRYFIIGDQDEFCSGEIQEELIALYESKGFRSIRYEGNHDISIVPLKEILG